MSGTEKMQQTTAFYADDEPMDVTPSNTAVANKFSEDHNSGSSVHKTNMDAMVKLSAQTEARHSSQNFTNASVGVLMRLKDAVHHVSPQLCLPVEASSSIKTSQPFRFLDMPLELRLEIYELVVGGSQRVYVKSDLNNTIPRTIIPCSDHGSAGCLPRVVPDSSPPRYPPKHCQGTVIFSRMLCASYEAGHTTRQSTSISHDMQTGKQQIATTNLTSNQSTLCKHGDTCAGCAQDLRLLRTCRQIYDEARRVLYRSNTFVFLDFPTFAAYFGLIAPTQVCMPRSTEPNRLRAIQSMTKVELHGRVGGNDSLDFLWTSRLVRMGLGCLTSLTSLELNLKFPGSRSAISQWRIDDCMFSKPSSLRKLVVDLQYPNTSMRRRWRKLKFVDEGYKLEAAEELMRQMLKENGFRDKTKCFRELIGPPPAAV